MGEVSTRCTFQCNNWNAICLYHTAEMELPKICGTLPYASANMMVADMSKLINGNTVSIPVYAGVCGTDPTLLLEPYLTKLKQNGIFGIQNFPTVAIETERFRNNIESINLGFESELHMMKAAKKMGFDIFPFVFSEKEAEMVAKLHPEKIVIHPGLSAISVYEEGNTMLYRELMESIANVIRQCDATIKLYGYTETEEMLIQMQKETLDSLDGLYYSDQAWREKQ